MSVKRKRRSPLAPRAPKTFAKVRFGELPRSLVVLRGVSNDDARALRHVLREHVAPLEHLRIHALATIQRLKPSVLRELRVVEIDGGDDDALMAWAQRRHLLPARSARGRYSWHGHRFSSDPWVLFYAEETLNAWQRSSLRTWSLNRSDATGELVPSTGRPRKTPKPIEVSAANIDWFVRFQVGGETIAAIARSANVDHRAVQRATLRVARLLELEPRNTRQTLIPQ